MVFLHEGLGCLATWRDFPLQLCRRTGLGALVFSRAGYGGSDRAELPRRVDYMHQEALDVLPEVLVQAGIENALLVGHSDGASVALIHAGHDAIGRVGGLVLLAPHVFNETICVDSIRAAGERYRTTDLRKRLALHHGSQVDETFWGWHDIWVSPEFWHWNIEEYLPNIDAPVLILQGEDDEYGTIRQVEAIESGTAGPVTRRLLASCGHSPYRDQPGACLDAIEAFLSKHYQREGVKS